MDNMNRRVTVLVHDATSEIAEPFYEITQQDYAGKLEIPPGQRLMVSNNCKSYSELRETLISKYEILPAEIPPSEYFAPTAGELADKTDPIIRSIPKN